MNAPTYPRLVVANADPLLGCFVRELMARRAQPVELVEVATPVERFQLRPWVDGYVIYDRGQLIATFHGPQFDLASKLLRLLKEDDEAPTPDEAA